MTATNQNVVHWQGDTKTIRIKVTDDAGNPVDLTAGSARWWLGKNVKATGTDVYIKKSTGAGGGASLDFDGTFWTVVVGLTPGDTGNLSGHFYHECEVIDAAGNVSTVMIGKYTLMQALIPTP